MERKVILVCCAVGSLGLLSAATGFAAEATKIKGDQIQSPSPTVCIHPRSPAFNLGLTAAVSLMIAQMIIDIANGGICCIPRKGPHQSNPNRMLARICFVVSWCTFAIAFLLLLTGAALNDQHDEEDNVYYGYYNCYVVVKPGVFTGASILSLCTVILRLIYYIILTSEKNRIDPFTGSASAPPTQAGGIAVGQPQFPPQHASDPVFVHEDTYTRRQFV